MHELKEKCGIFGVYGKGLDVSRLTFFGLFSLQHRGQESSGIAVSDGKSIASHKDKGLVAQAFDEEIIKGLAGHIAIGHNRYSTSLGTGLEHAQPIVVNDPEPSRGVGGALALAHNGNLPSVTALQDFLRKQGKKVEGRSDSQLMADALAHFVKGGASLEEAVRKCFPLFTGSFSLLVMMRDTLVAVRDECGIKPLSIGKLNGGFVVSSETCAFSTIGAAFVQDVLPGEMVIFDGEGMRSSLLALSSKQKLDVFEFIYFARPDSVLLGKSVYEARRNCGRELAKEAEIIADVVVPVPETSIPGAIGYSQESGIPFEMGIVKNRYIHRTFIEPDEKLRNQGARMKLTPLPAVLRGRRVIVVDDSVVRGTTTRNLVSAIFEVGAKEVHLVITSPPVCYPDFYGIDTPDQTQLLAFTKNVDEIREFLGVNSLHYLSYRGLIKGIGVPEEQLCTSCLTGMYPIDLRERKKEVAPACIKVLPHSVR
jgi:amidophosphoribosyltransferase